MPPPSWTFTGITRKRGTKIVLLVQLKEMKNFTNHEKDIANYILAHMEQIPDMSAGELAKSTLTSKATVVRLSQKLGLSGYHEFMLYLIAEGNLN